MRGNPITWPGAALALASAILFGASTPIAKLLLGDGVSPWLLAGLLYLGSGIGGVQGGSNSGHAAEEKPATAAVTGSERAPLKSYTTQAFRAF